jgi:hypothetical protein
MHIVHQPKFQIGDILATKNKVCIGVVSNIEIHMSKDGQQIVYIVKVNHALYRVPEVDAIKLEEACPF